MQRHGWTPECITKLGLDVKVESMQEAELLKVCCFFYYLTQTELRSYHIDLRPFGTYHIVLTPALNSRIPIT